MTVKKTQKTLNTTLEKTEQTLDGLEQAFDSTVGAGLLANTGLPEEWCEIKISEVAEVVAGGTPKAGDPSNFADPGSSIAWLTPADLSKYKSSYISHGKRDLSQSGYDSSSAKLLPKGSLLFSSRAPIGYVAIASNEISTNQGFKNFVFQSGVNSLFAYYYLNSIRSLAESLGTGTTFKEISGATAKKLPFILPPLAEQTVIAQTLDTLLAQVDNIKTRLDAIPKILKTFRQSVLAAAVSGKLTEEWRGENECGEWEQVKLSKIVEKIEAGKSLKCTERPPIGDELGIIKISAVTWGVYDEDESKTLPSPDLFIESRRVQVGDFLISRANTIELLGNPVIVHAVSKNLMLSDKVLRLVMAEEDKQWVSMFLRSSKGRKAIESGSTGNQNSMRNIGQKALLNIDIPKPNAAEQTQIVHRVKELFAFADQVEQQVKNAQKRVNTLTQSILAKAFRGELTAQWRAENPDLITGDNSAEALLAKIQQERKTFILKKSSRKQATSRKVKIKEKIKN